MTALEPEGQLSQWSYEASIAGKLWALGEIGLRRSKLSHRNSTAIRVGIIGSGGMAAERAAHIGGHPELALASVAGRNPESRAALARRHGASHHADWRELVATEGLDALFVATLPDTHAEVSLAALEHGLHVFCEPPLAIDTAAADAVVAMARSRGLVVRVGHTPVLRPAARVVAKQVERLGGSVLDDVRIHFPDDERRGRTAGFDMRVTGHPLVYAITLGLPAISGKGPLASLRATTQLGGEAPVFETCVATSELTFASGAVSMIAYLRGFQWAGQGWRTVACRRGSVRVVDGEEYVAVTTPNGLETVPLPEDDSYETEIADFVRAVRTGAPLAFTLEDARQVVAIADAAQMATREDRAVAVELPGL